MIRNSTMCQFDEDTSEEGVYVLNLTNLNTGFSHTYGVAYKNKAEGLSAMNRLKEDGLAIYLSRILVK